MDTPLRPWTHPSDLGHAPPTLGMPHHGPQPLMCLVGMSKVPDTPEQLPSGVCLAPRARVSWRCYFLGQRQGRCPPGRQWGQADVGGNTSPLQSLPPPIPVRLHSPTSLSLSHTHTHTHRAPKGKETSSQSPGPRPRGQQPSGMLTAAGGPEVSQRKPACPPASCLLPGQWPQPRTQVPRL